MDETANQMSDVRERLINALGDMRAHVLAQLGDIEQADHPTMPGSGDE